MHQAGCNGCIGMGQAPATGRNSLRTTPRNFPGRSGTIEDSVYLCGTETAAASVLTGVITDPRTLGPRAPKVKELKNPTIDLNLLDAPLPVEEARKVIIQKVQISHQFRKWMKCQIILQVPILLKMGDNISTDEILAGGSRVLPFRSNLPEISKFSFEIIDRHIMSVEWKV